jgi:hypothetical protein
VNSRLNWIRLRLERFCFHILAAGSAAVFDKRKTHRRMPAVGCKSFLFV